MPDTLSLDRLTTLAGPDYTWSGPATGHRLSSDPRAGLRSWLHTQQHGTCAFCGEVLGEGFDLCHLVSGGPGRRGFIPGNIAAGCRACNEIDGENGPVVSVDSIMRPDLIPSEWPPITVLTQFGRDEKREKECVKARKRAVRGL